MEKLLLMNIRNMRYVDVSDLSDEAYSAYTEFTQKCGIYNKEPVNWEVGAVGNDHVFESWIGREKCDIINAELRMLGLKDGDDINLIHSW